MWKMEDWDLADHKRLPHLVTSKYMMKIYYEETGVMWLEPMKWVRGVEQAGLMHMLSIPHFHRLTINMVCVCQLLTLVHYGCLWLWEAIPITNILIHRITNIPYKGVDPAKEFGGKGGEKVLADNMKVK